MIKVMSFSSNVRTQHSGWVSIVWFTSAVSIAVSQGVKLQTTSETLSAQCGENLALTCEATSSQPLDIKLFTWLARNKTVCQYEDGQHDPEVLCESDAKAPHYQLTLTLLNVMPVHQGNYLCKIQSDRGGKSATTHVTVQDCFGSSDSSINTSHAKCWFSGIYPSGIIHWFKGDVDLTDSARTKEEKDQHGRYNVSSEIDVQAGNLSQPYKCLLWIPSDRKYLSSQELPMVGEQTVPVSSGSMVQLQWLCIMLAIMMERFIT